MTLDSAFSIQIYLNSSILSADAAKAFEHKVRSYFPDSIDLRLDLFFDNFAEVVRGKFSSKLLENVTTPVLFFDGRILWLVGAKNEASSFDLEEISRTLKIHQKGVDPILRALGAKEKDLLIFDFTAGTLRDAIHMTKLGHRVMAFERHPVVYALLKNALERSSFQQLITLHFGEAQSYTFEDSLRPDVVYYDPMFDGHEDKSGKSRKEMELFHQLFQALPFMETASLTAKKVEEEKTLQFALTLAKKRVIVKRTPKAIVLRPPTFQMLTKAVRFDVYQR